MSLAPYKNTSAAGAIADIYLAPVRQRLPEVISRLDKEPFSKTYGSFDRTFWCWKFTDFSATRFQEGIYSLARFYTDPSSDLYQKPDVLQWIKAGFTWWQKLQHRQGSFDEAYPFEHSFAATAFTCFYLGEAFDLIKDTFDENEKKSLISTFEKAGDWFLKNDETHGILSNHLAAGVGALHHIARITGKNVYQQRADFFLNRIYQKQSSEGWYEEYGGADPGYQTHGMFYLARVWQLTQDDKLLDSLDKAATFIEHTLNPDGTIGGEYASRNTTFFYPAAFEMLAGKSKAAARIAIFMRPMVQHNIPTGLPAMDAWNLFPVLNNYLFAADNTAAAIAPPLAQNHGQSVYKKAGWVIERKNRYQAVLGLSKGGVIKAWTGNEKPQLSFSDCGYWARTKKGTVISSQSLTTPPVYTQNGDVFELTCTFTEVNQKVMNPVLFVGFRGFTILFGQIPMLAYSLKKILVRALVSRRKKSALTLKRTVTFTEDGFDVTDVISTSKPVQLSTLVRGKKFSTIHMGSSRYHQNIDFSADNNDVHLPKAAEKLSAGQSVTLHYQWRVHT